MALLNVYFFSEVLGKQVQANVVLPQRSRGMIGMDSIENKVETYPTLYLLHGMRATTRSGSAARRSSVTHPKRESRSSCRTATCRGT